MGWATGGSLEKCVRGWLLQGKQPAPGNRVKVFPNTMRALLAARSPIHLVLTAKIRPKNRTVVICVVNYKINNQLLVLNFYTFSQNPGTLFGWLYLHSTKPAFKQKRA